MQHRSERKYLKDIRKGRPEACEEIVHKHYKAIYRFMAHLTNDKNLAEDLTQETFLSAWARIDQYKGQASMATWLHKIAYHKFIDSRRKLENHTNMLTRLKTDNPTRPQPTSPLGKLMADEHSRLLYEAIHKLAPSEYLVILLHYIQALTFREMAAVLDRPVGTVKWQTSRALKKLKTFLTGKVQS